MNKNKKTEIEKPSELDEIIEYLDFRIHKNNIENFFIFRRNNHSKAEIKMKYEYFNTIFKDFNTIVVLNESFNDSHDIYNDEICPEKINIEIIDDGYCFKICTRCLQFKEYSEINQGYLIDKHIAFYSKFENIQDLKDFMNKYKKEIKKTYTTMKPEREKDEIRTIIKHKTNNKIINNNIFSNFNIKIKTILKNIKGWCPFN